MRIKKPLAVVLAILLLTTSVLSILFVASSLKAKDDAPTAALGGTAKYVFVFIGDGMSASQIHSAEILSEKLGGSDQIGLGRMAFTQFPSVGFMTTYDAESFIPDSASAATAMFTGNATLGGVVNMDTTKTQEFTIISELAKAAGYKIGTITTVSIDHATPACFYAKQASRSDYYNIGLQLVSGDFDFFGGGGFVYPEGKEGDEESLIEIAKKNGFTVPANKEEILALDAGSGKVLAINPVLFDDAAMLYEIDRLNHAPESLSLAQIVEKGIEVLDNDDGFLMMVEGGKVDWACHANDAAAAFHDIMAMDDAIKVALTFAEKHPDDTLIVVTGDHETGGLSIGYAATGTSTYFEKLLCQTMSYVKFDELVAGMREEQALFDKAFEAVNEYFGLIAPDAPEAAEESNAGMVLSEREYQLLKDAYALSLKPADERDLNENQQLLYGTYEPFSMACTHTLNNKAGISWSTYAHSGVPLPVFAKGVGAEAFAGSYHNTDIFHKLVSAMGLAQ